MNNDGKEETGVDRFSTLQCIINLCTNYKLAYMRLEISLTKYVKRKKKR